MGVHWDFDDTFGQQLGRQIADFAFDRFLEPRGPHAAGPKSPPISPAFSGALAGAGLTFTRGPIAQSIGLSDGPGEIHDVL